MHEVFISYKSEEAAKAYAIKNVLEKNNISCWMAPNSIPPGADYACEITNAIERCKVFVVLMSSLAQTSNHIRTEIEIAFNNNKIIIPYMLEECELTNAFKYLLNGRQHVEANLTTEEKVQRLVKRIQNEIAFENNDIDFVGTKTINNKPIGDKQNKKYGIAIVATLAFLLLISIFTVGMVHLLSFNKSHPDGTEADSGSDTNEKSHMYEVESFYIVTESEKQYYDEKFVFAGKSYAPIVNIYISNTNSEESERFLIARVEVSDGNFRFETVGKSWWTKCNLFEVVPCDKDGEEIPELTKLKEVQINYHEQYEPLRILGSPYCISKEDELLISWKDIYADTSVIYNVQIIDVESWEDTELTSTVFFRQNNIKDTSYLLRGYLLEPGEYVIIVWGSASGHTSSADYAYLTVE